MTRAAGAEQRDLFPPPESRQPENSQYFEVYIAPSARLVEVPDNYKASTNMGGVAGARMQRQFGLIPVLCDYDSLPDNPPHNRIPEKEPSDG